MTNSNSSKLSTFAQLRELPLQPATIIAVCLTQRMWVNAQLYLQYQNQTNMLEELSSVMTGLWMMVSRQRKVNTEKFRVILDEIEKTEFEDSLAYRAFVDFCVSASVCLDALDKEEKTPAVVLAKISQGGIERFIIETEQSGAELSPQELKQHELMQFELDTTHALIDYVTEHKINPDMITQIQSQLSEEPISNLGLSL